MNHSSRLRRAATVAAATTTAFLLSMLSATAVSPATTQGATTAAEGSGSAATAEAAPASRAGFKYFECHDAYQCVIPFLQPQGESVVYNIEVTGGVHQHIAVSVDPTLNVPGCHPTIYPGQYYHFSCFDPENMGGKMVLRAWAGDRHNFRIGIWLP
ncbi:hypothetical protein [Streptomyces venezuelae]|uniref:hypothetical protein n=1 Tax=Streptomyces venezuelae TaxID=54571 RepID=UPI00343481F1